MTTLYHNDTAYRTSGSCVLISGIGSVPVNNPPAGVYPDGGRDTPPEGQQATGWHRIVRDGKSVLTWTELEAVEPPPPPVSRYSKLRIVRALQAAGLFASFRDWLALDAAIEEQWYAASEVSSDDPVFGQALPAFAAACGLTEEQIAAMLESCEV